jgi:hypothetical protein
MSDNPNPEEKPVEPENRARIFLDIDADYDFETGTFTPKQQIELTGGSSGCVVSMGDITSPPDMGEQHWLNLPGKTFRFRATWTPNGFVFDKDEDQESSDQEGEE